MVALVALPRADQSLRLASDIEAKRGGRGDGIVKFGGNGVVDLDGPDAGIDTIEIDGVNGQQGLRFLGDSCEGVYIYAQAIVRPKGATEGRLGDSTLTADKPDLKTNVHFFDTALDIFLGSDAIENFGMNDALVTTSKLFDSNDDGVVEFGGNNILDLSGGTGGPVDQNVPGEVGSVAITDTNGTAVSSLEFDGSVSKSGVQYFVYSRVGSSGADIGDVLLA